MTIFSRLLVGAAGVGMAALAAAPASAQYYPQPSYNQGYGQQGGGIIGQVISQVLGGGRYGAYGQGNHRLAVDQCARAAEMRVSQDQRRGYGAYGQGYGNQGYHQGQGRAQVVGITGVERKQSGLKVTGLIDTGMGYSQGQYGQYGQYGQAYGQYGQPYPGQAYPNPGYGNPGYGNQAYAAQSADLRFSCRVDHRGRITELDIRRNRRG